MLDIFSRKYAHKIFFIVKINHNEFLGMPYYYEQTLFGAGRGAWDMGVANWRHHLLGQCQSARQSKELQESVATAVINKQAGGRGPILGQKAFQRPFAEGVEFLNLIQDVYLDNSIAIA